MGRVTEQIKSSIKTEAENATKDVWPQKNQNGWRICSNDELQVMYRKPNIVTTVTARRLE